MLRAILLSLALTSATLAEISVPEVTPLYQFVEIKCLIPDFAEGIECREEWIFPKELDIPSRHFILPDGAGHLLVGPPGTYNVTVRLNLFVWDKKRYDRQEFTTTFTIGDTPGPVDPNSDPDPDVVPDGERVLVIVRESTNVSLEIVSLINELRTSNVASYLIEHGHKLYIFDPDVIGDEVFDSLAKEEVEYPALFILDSDLKILSSIPLPSSSKEVLKFVQKHGG